MRKTGRGSGVESDSSCDLMTDTAAPAGEARTLAAPTSRSMPQCVGMTSRAIGKSSHKLILGPTHAALAVYLTWMLASPQASAAEKEAASQAEGASQDEPSSARRRASKEQTSNLDKQELSASDMLAEGTAEDGASLPGLAESSPGQTEENVSERTAAAGTESANTADDVWDPCRAQAGEAVGRVLEVRDGIVTLSKDPDALIGMGDRVGFHDERGDERIVGSVTRVNNKTYEVRIHLHEDVRTGEAGYRTAAEPTASMVAPPLGNYTVAAGLELKPWLGLNGSDSGFLVEGFFLWRVSKRLRLRAAVDPASPPIGDGPGALEAFIAPSLAFDIAEIGFGVGVGTANHLVGAPVVGVLLSPNLRFGAEDGLAFRARSSAVAFADRAVFGSFRLDAEIPIGYGKRLLLGGGGGDSGYAYGETGLELLVEGNGGAGTWFVRSSLGYGGTHGRTTGAGGSFGSIQNAHGPYMSLGAEVRL